MAIANFKPEIWSPRILQAYDKSFVFTNLVNRNYEGAINNFGDVVRINEVGDISVQDYGSTGMGTPGELTDAQKTLQIDQAKAWHFRVDDVDAAQARPGVMDEAMRKAGVAIANTVDQFLAGFYDTGGLNSTSTGLGSTGSAVAVNSTNVAEHILYAGELLDIKNVPMEGRWMAIPPWFHRRLVLSQVLQGGKYLDDPNSNALRTGMVGQGLGFNFYLTNNVSKGSTHSRIMFGTPDAITYASQLSKVEAYRPEQFFADAVRGLYLYGAKTVQPDALGTLYAYGA